MERIIAAQTDRRFRFPRGSFRLRRKDLNLGGGGYGGSDPPGSLKPMVSRFFLGPNPF